MSSGVIVMDLHGDGRREGWLQPLAGGELWCDEQLPGGTPLRAPRPEASQIGQVDRGELIYDGPGLLAGTVQRIRCWLEERGSRVELGGETFRVAADGSRVERVVAVSGQPLGAHTLTHALGPPLVLALAAQGIFLLHASAVRGPRGVAALTAATGVGKSTLASAARAHPELGLERVADDQLPVRLADPAWALPRFPQLKLELGEQYPSDAPVELPLAMVVVLERLPEAKDRELVALEPLARDEATLTLVRSTVAARLFDPALLAQHCAACAVASATVEVLRLRYSGDLSRVKAALRPVAARLSSASR